MPERDLILLAMDTLPVLHLMERALQAASYEPVPVLDLASLNQVLQTSTPDLAIIGERFDEVSGGKIVSDILDRFPTMPILAYLEKDTPGAVKMFWSTGALGYLSSPLGNDDIVDKVERSLERARHLGDWVRSEVKRTTASLERRAQLSESELDRYEKIIEHTQDGIIILDEAGNVILLNKTIIEVFQLGKTPWRGKPAEQVLSHPDMHALFKRAKTVPLQYHEVNIDDERVFNAKYTFIPGVGVVITMQDVSYLRRLDQIKSEFVHTVSHDLRSPLTSVLGYAELIRRVGPLNAQQQEYLAHIRSSVESITSMVDDLLGLSRIEAGFDMRREVVGMDNILNLTLDGFESQFTLAEITLNLNIESDLPKLRANPIHFRQLLDNLIGNAIKYSPKGGVINIDLKSENKQVILMVEDSGIGIPKEDQARIFDKFYRATNVSSEVEGVGLGLSIVKSIVAAHQGRIWVESAKGQGAKFFVVLPADVPDEEE
jgi:PAS domain S-box-containing protein